MPLDISTEGLREKNKLNSDGVWHQLVEFLYPATASPSKAVRVCLNNEALTWNGYTWNPMAFEIGNFDETKESEIPKLQLQFYDPTRAFFSILDENDGIIGAKVSIYILHSNNLGTSTYDYAVDFVVTDTSINSNYVIIFTLGDSNLMNYKCPTNIYLRNFCRFIFKDNYCQYTGSETTCNGTLARCRELGNQARFGGFPGIPNGAVFV